MATLKVLGSDAGFTPGDLSLKGYIGVVPAFQKVFIADGRPSNEDIAVSGYHKIDMTSTCLVGEASGAFTVGEGVTQATSGATGIFVESVGTGATEKNLFYRTSTVEFVVTEVVTGAVSSVTLAPTIVIAPPLWLNWVLPSQGEPNANLFPDGGSNVMGLFEGRIWMNSMYNPNQWLATYQGNPFDLDLSTDIDDIRMAISSQTSLAGEVGDAIVAFIPYKNIYLLFGCAESIWILRGGSTGGGTISNLSYETGIFSPDSFCWDNNGNLYIIGMNGFYKIPNGAATSETAFDSISDRLTPGLFSGLKLNRLTDRVVMGFDKERNSIEVAISMQDGMWSVCYCYDIANDALFPDSFNAIHTPTSFLYVNSPVTGVGGLLIGNQDGYIRRFDDETKTDDGLEINSFSLFGPISIANFVRADAKIRAIQVELSDGCDGLQWGLYSATTAQELVGKIKRETVAFSNAVKNGIFTTGGRQDLIDDKLSGEYIGILFKNKTINTSWGLEAIRILLGYSGKEKS